MGYNVTDIINKAVAIAIKRRTINETIGQENPDNLSIKIISNVLIKELDKTIEYYETLLSKISDVEFEEIDFSIYDKMSSLINDFNKRIDIEIKINNVREYLRFSLELEKSIYSLMMDIQGRFVKNTSDIHSKTYKILSNIIDNKVKHIEMLEKITE
ncbi:hypothetical protein UF75_0711 [Desulfosporosinus sp. I2]|uniref:hypothetical protein n=1 Tax=Desulfosporosinus sp. I2 TaxID=1617025 RepID=UPI0005EF60C7|nr:hypothetical protein [Desulfosporosinus sp. I2]KJR48824.1 hypothetical protein UF75_0711 [Desulfosporosinus sp. I2]